MNRYETKEELVVFLSPTVREVHLYQSSRVDDIPYIIDSFLSFIFNAVSSQGEHVEIVYKTLTQSDKRSKSVLRFPHYGKRNQSKISRDAKQLATLCHLLNTIKERFKSGTSTIRDVYYSNVELYRKQTTVEKWLKIIETNFQLDSHKSVGIVPAQKGLAYSSFDIFIHQKGCINKMNKGNINLIPYLDDDSKIQIDIPSNTLKVDIIVLEKDAVFNKITREKPSNTIILTGKGYPDFLTRKFLHKLQLCNFNLILNQWKVFTDADPYGVHIALTYTLSNPIESNLNCTKLIYSGASIAKLIDKRRIQLLNLSQRDVSFTQSLISRTIPLISNKTSVQYARPYVKELQRQLFFHKKGEMNKLELRDYLNC